MPASIRLFELKQTDRRWHFPLIVCLSTGIPLLVGYYVGNIPAGSLASLGGLVILYLPPPSLNNRMVTLITCSVGFTISYALGICFSFSPYLSAFVLGLFSGVVHLLVNRLNVNPPQSFFFIMLISMASCMPYNPQTIPERIGLIGIGTVTACLFAFIYSWLTAEKKSSQAVLNIGQSNLKTVHSNLPESILFGVFMLTSVLIGQWFKLKNPYWIPISCAAVMQGINIYHVWQRSFHRILGTILGVGLCWGVLSITSTPLLFCVMIILFQYAVELLIVRHYGLAVIFMTPLAILLTEISQVFSQTPLELLEARLIDITLGSLIGSVGGWFIHHEKLRQTGLNTVAGENLD